MRIGLDIGGSTTAAVLLDSAGEVAARSSVPTGYGAEEVLSSSMAAVAALWARGQRPVSVSVGVGIPGLVEPATGHVRNAVNLGISSLDLAGALAAGLGAPIRVENDVNAAALGAHHQLAAAGPIPASMAYLNLGTGLASGLVLDGRLWRGASGVAGEIGHASVDPAGLRCPCGQRGCLETLCGGWAIARRWPAPDQPPPAALFAAAAAGSPKARAIQSDVFRGIAEAIRIITLSMDVERIVLGGGLSALGEPLLTGVRATLEQLAEGSPFLQALDIPARLRLVAPGGDVGALGAALMAPQVPAPLRG